jgi:hypothetical protein
VKVAEPRRRPQVDLISALFVLAVSGAAIVTVFLILRQGVLWYWRINEAVELLRSIERNTRPAGMAPPAKPRTLDQMAADARVAREAKEVLENARRAREANEPGR